MSISQAVLFALLVASNGRGRKEEEEEEEEDEEEEKVEEAEEDRRRRRIGGGGGRNGAGLLHRRKKKLTRVQTCLEYMRILFTVQIAIKPGLEALWGVGEMVSDGLRWSIRFHQTNCTTTVLPLYYKIHYRFIYPSTSTMHPSICQ